MMILMMISKNEKEEKEDRESRFRGLASRNFSAFCSPKNAGHDSGGQEAQKKVTSPLKNLSVLPFKIIIRVRAINLEKPIKLGCWRTDGLTQVHHYTWNFFAEHFQFAERSAEPKLLVRTKNGQFSTRSIKCLVIFADAHA